MTPLEIYQEIITEFDHGRISSPKELENMIDDLASDSAYELSEDSLQEEILYDTIVEEVRVLVGENGQLIDYFDLDI